MAKTFNTDTAAELFITEATPGEAAADKRNPPQAQMLDPHADEKAKGQYLQELTNKAIELERKARGIKIEAEIVKRQAIAASNIKLRGASKTKYRVMSDYDNPRTRRAQVIMRPDVYNRAKQYCDQHKISFNRFVELVTLAFLDGETGTEGKEK